MISLKKNELIQMQNSKSSCRPQKVEEEHLQLFRMVTQLTHNGNQHEKYSSYNYELQEISTKNQK